MQRPENHALNTRFSYNQRHRERIIDVVIASHVSLLERQQQLFLQHDALDEYLELIALFQESQQALRAALPQILVLKLEKFYDKLEYYLSLNEGSQAQLDSSLAYGVPYTRVIMGKVKELPKKKKKDQAISHLITTIERALDLMRITVESLPSERVTEEAPQVAVAV